MAGSVGSDVDAALAARLERLAASRAGVRRDAVAPSARTGGAPKKRRHPAQHSRTAALLLSVLASGGLGVLFAATDQPVSASAERAGIVTATTAPTPPPASAPSVTTPTPPPASAPPVTATTVAPATTAPGAADVTINGSIFTNKWGDVQVQAIFAPDGTINKVTALRTPSRDGKSVNINNRAVPQLNSEALTAQSAAIHTVSGATYTSNDYKKSLQSAVDIATVNGIPLAPAAA